MQAIVIDHIEKNRGKISAWLRKDQQESTRIQYAFSTSFIAGRLFRFSFPGLVWMT